MSHAVSRDRKRGRLPRRTQLLAVTALAAAVILFLSEREGSFVGLWLSKDQQAMRAFNARDYGLAAELFDDANWSGVAAYRIGQYESAAASFGQAPTAAAFFNRGNALMKAFDYRSAVASFEQAVAEAPAWTEAKDNLALARHTLDYIEGAREESGTGGQLGADDVVFDAGSERGERVQVDRSSTLTAESAEKWMRTVDTETAEFLRSRFLLEASLGSAP